MTPSELNKIIKQHALWISSSGKQGRKADLIDVCLKNVCLDGVDLSEYDLSEADLSEDGLLGAILNEANQNLADLSARLRNADLKEARLILDSYLGKGGWPEWVKNSIYSKIK